MKFHVICEGPQDQLILERIIDIIIKKPHIFITPSNTQTKNRGVSSILDKKRFFQFLHYSFKNEADYLLICIDNDEKAINNEIPERYSILQSYYTEFKNKSKSYPHHPKEMIIIPIQTIDYWILAGLSSNSGPGTLLGIEKIPKQGIKTKVYGQENISKLGLIINSRSYMEKLDYAINERTINGPLLHLSSFIPLHNFLMRVKEEISNNTH
jgi:hypothetical protein